MLIDPHRRRHIYHAVLLRNGLLLVDQRGVFRLRGDDPGPRVFGAAGVLRHGNDFEVFVLQFFVERLPAWQVETAASPGRPGDEQNFLATKVSERMQLAIQIRERKVRRF